MIMITIMIIIRMIILVLILILINIVMIIKLMIIVIVMSDGGGREPRPPQWRASRCYKYKTMCHVCVQVGE